MGGVVLCSGGVRICQVLGRGCRWEGWGGAGPIFNIIYNYLFVFGKWKIDSN